jgi:hypothetical protein
MFEDEAGFDAQIRCEIVGDGDALELVMQALNGGHEELEGINATLRVPHIEFPAGAVGEPEEISFAGSDARPVTLGSEFAAVFVGVEAVFELDDADAHVFIEQEFDGAFSGAGPSGVGIEIEMQIGGVAPQHAYLLDGERSAATGDDFGDARLARADSVHVAFDENDAIGHHGGLAGAVQVKKHVRLFVDLRFRRVQIFRFFFGIESPATEGDDFARFIVDREHEAIAETVVK